MKHPRRRSTDNIDLWFGRIALFMAGFVLCMTISLLAGA